MITFGDYATIKYNSKIGEIIMKDFMCTHTFHSEETKKFSSKLILERKVGTGLVQPMMKIVLNVSQHGSENMTSGFVTGELRVKI